MSATGWTGKRYALHAAAGAALGVMILFGTLGGCIIVEGESHEGFAGWMAYQKRTALEAPGMNALVARHGDDAVYQAPGFVKSYYVFLHLALRGIVAGALIGLVVAVIRSRRAAPDAAPDGGPDEEAAAHALPATVPPALAVLGMCWHGCVWGNVAVASLFLSRRTRRTVAFTWIVGFLAVVLWSWALATVWGPGWSQELPAWLRDFIYWVGHLLGLKE